MGSVAFMDAAGVTLGARGGMPVGMGPFHVVLAERNGPPVATGQSAELVSLAPPPPPPPPPPAVAPPVPTFDYFQAQLTPYGHWIDVPGIGAAWVPNEASIPGLATVRRCRSLGIYGCRLVLALRLCMGRNRVPLWPLDQRCADWFRLGLGTAIRLGTIVGYLALWREAAWAGRRCLGKRDTTEESGIGDDGGVAVDVDFGLSVDAFVFVGHDHFFRP